MAKRLLRVPDKPNDDALIEDKIGTFHWRDHIGQSESSLVNASTYALEMTRSVINKPEKRGPLDALRGA